MALNYTVQGFSRPPREVYGKAMEAAIKALQLDPELAEAHAALGYAKLNYEWDWAGAESEFRKAIELNPGSSDAHWMYAVYLTAMMRFDEATSEVQQAHQLDPFSPTINDLTGWVLMYERRYGDAIAQFKRTLELEPGYRLSHSWLAACYISKRMYPEARGELDELGLPADDPSRGVIDWLTGNKKQALKCAESLKRRAQHEYVDPFYVAVFYSGLGDKDAAFAWLEKGFEGRSANMPQMNIEPGFDLLRSDPHFRDLLLRMNLPQ
jgi:adenylate cyclase